MRYGVYAFKENGKYIYIGLDSNCDKEERFRAHLKPSRRYKLAINDYLQQDYPKWEYILIAKFRHRLHMKQYEEFLIKKYKPFYNLVYNKSNRKK